MKAIRRTWTKQEDEAIITLVKELGTKAWIEVSQKLTQEFKLMYRSPKQCRERWHNHLDVNVLKDKWTDEEHKILIEKQKIYGNKWAKIAKFLPGRTDNCVKNKFYSSIRRKNVSQHQGKNNSNSDNQSPQKQIPEIITQVNQVQQTSNLESSIINQQNMIILPDIQMTQVSTLESYEDLNKISVFTNQGEIQIQPFQQCQRYSEVQNLKKEQSNYLINQNQNSIGYLTSMSSFGNKKCSE